MTLRHHLLPPIAASLVLAGLLADSALLAQTKQPTTTGGKQTAKQPQTPPGKDTAAKDTGKKKKDDTKKKEDETPKAPEFNYALARIDELESQIADRIASQRTNDPITAIATSADINFRLAAISLLRTGVSKGPSGALAIVYGHTLADAAPDAQTLFEKAAAKIKTTAPGGGAALPGIAAAAQPTGNLPSTPLSTALAKFNSDTDAAFGTLRDASDKEVDSYLIKVMAPLAALAQAMEMPQPVNSWVIVTPRKEADVAAAPRQITDADLDALLKRAHAAAISSALKNEMVITIEQMKRGWNQAAQRPLLAGMYDPIQEVLDVSEAVGSAAWIGEATIGDLKKQLEVSFFLIKDARLRNFAVERLDAMNRGLTLVKQITALDKLQVPVEPLRNLYLLAHQLSSRKQDVKSAGLIIEYLEQLTALMLEVRSLKVDTLPLELRRTAQAIQKEQQASELDLMKKLPDLQTTPSAIEDVAWAGALKQLSDRIALTRRVAAIPSWTDRLLKFKPRNATRLGITLRGIAGNIGTPSKREAAETQLAQLEQQMAAFDPLRREQLLRNPSAATKALVGDSLRMLNDQLDRLRTDWATNWANGTDTKETADKLTKLSRLLDAIDSASALADADAIIDRLNRWAAWQGRVDALKPLLKTMSERIAAAAKLAGSSDWTTLDTTITQVQTEAPLPILIARLDATIGQQLATLPDGVTGCLGQTLYAPRPVSFAFTDRLELAQLSAYMLEAAHASTNNATPQLDAILTYTGYVSKLVLDDLDGKRHRDDQPKP